MWNMGNCVDLIHVALCDAQRSGSLGTLVWPNPRLLRAGPSASTTASVDSFKDAVASAAPPQKHVTLGRYRRPLAIA